MKNKIPKTKSENLLNIGYSLFFPGVMFATIPSNNRILQIIGVILLIASSIVFTAAAKQKTKGKSK